MHTLIVRDGALMAQPLESLSVTWSIVIPREVFPYGYATRAPAVKERPPGVVGAFCRLDVVRGTGHIAALKKPVVSRSLDVLSGTPVFAGTRVPIKNLIDYLEGNESIEEFLDDFPTVKRQQVIAFLEEAQKRVVATAG